ncbi:MAG: S8 family peptidase [Agitococcus sp.]|nr:S8 family peptidase [Agitococcus sp.]
MPYAHLQLTREEPVKDRHPRKGYGLPPPANPRAFGSNLQTRLARATRDIQTHDVGGFDNRLMMRVNLIEGASISGFANIETILGVTIISQEESSVVITMATPSGLAEFSRRVDTLATTGTVIRKETLFAIDDITRWTPEDRKGRALREQGFSQEENFVLDVELFPYDSPRERTACIRTFQEYCTTNTIEILDRLEQPSLLMLRIRLSREQAELLLNYRDVRTLDLPPKIGLSMQTLLADINDFPDIPEPDEDAPRLVVLDSGINSGHPVLAPAMGDSQGFADHRRIATDDSGHGTFVAGIALYGDVTARIQQGAFIPELRIMSGRVFNDDNQDQTKFVEKSVIEAVRYFHSTYQCRVFNLSYGDRNKIYDGRHVRGLAYTLDCLTRELDVLFIVPTGNLLAEEVVDYPTGLLNSNCRLLDPATSLNAITVGGLAHTERSFDAQRHPLRIEETPFARVGQPSPITRSGFSIGNAIKPDLVEAAGNLARMRTQGHIRSRSLGVVSLNADFADNRPFREEIGTSFAAPRIAHWAAKLANRFATNSVNLVRAILASHARWPLPTIQLLNPGNTEEGKESLLRIAGYGQLDENAVLDSIEQVVTLYAEDLIHNDRSHFYELPIPDEVWSTGRRERQVSIALAYSPEVKTTRMEYRHCKLSFTLIRADSLEQVATAFTRGRVNGMSELSLGRTVSNQARKTSTLQSSTWNFQLPPRNLNQKLFVVVTRQDSPWSTLDAEAEQYALSVVIRDRENTTVNLHARVETILQARGQARERARARL